MPIYAYRCSACGHAKDVLQKMSDPVLTVCPACGAPTFQKQVTAAGFQLKGSGWYVTDFRGGNTAKGGKNAEGEGGGSGAEGEGGKPAVEGAPASDKALAGGAAATGTPAPAPSPAPAASSSSSSTPPPAPSVGSK